MKQETGNKLQEAVMKFKNIIQSSVFLRLASMLLLGTGGYSVYAQADAAELTVRSIMKQQVDPNAKAIWDAVSYTANEQGVEERSPSSDADWMALRANAIALMEAARALRQPNLRAAAASNPEATPDYQYRPEEIEALMQSQADAWASYLEAMETYTLQTMSAITRKDVSTFSEVNANINEACQQCHASFWYRPTL